jgi:hypothetical protein
VVDEHTRLAAFRRHINERRPFDDYVDQPDTAERARLAVYSIPFALPAKRVAWDAIGDAVAWPTSTDETSRT